MLEKIEIIVSIYSHTYSIIILSIYLVHTHIHIYYRTVWMKMETRLKIT